jgi:DNA polymerase-3 subunit gamma/tau
MLTEAACNALLKTLEEPPPHVIFVLATTEAHKVLATIVSRCQRFNFHRLRQTEIMDKLGLICRKETIHIEPGSLELIARAATGSLRDAENILQQMIAYYGNQISRCVVSRDVTAGLKIVNSLNSDGVDLRQFNLGLVEYLRALLLTKSGCGEALDVTSEDLAEMNSLATNAPIDYLLKAVKSFSGIDFRSDSYSALSLEMALLDCVLSSQAAREQPTTIPSPEVVDASETTKPPDRVGADIPIAVDPDRVGTEDGSEVPTAVGASEIPGEDIPRDINYVRGRWREFIKSLRGEGSSGNLDAFLRSACDPVGLEDDTLVLGFYYSFHKEKIEDAKYRHLVEKKLKEVFGRPYKIRCVLVDSKREVPSQSRTQNPIVKAALEMGARISEVELQP